MRTSAQARLLSMEGFELGRFGEDVCANVLHSSGVTYIPLCRIEMGGAPLAVSSGGKTVLPDFDVIGEGVTAYIDVKVKHKSARYHNTGQVRHGIDDKNYQHYVAIGAIQRKQCGLFVVELLDDVENWSGTLLCDSFLSLGKPTPGFSNQKHMVYWPRKRFSVIGSYSADELLAIAGGQLSVEMGGLLKTAFAAPPRSCDSHNDPAMWRDEPERDSRGWIRTVCSRCNAFIGYRPPDGKISQISSCTPV